MLAAALPDNAGYVAAAYLVFLALLLVYFGIMVAKLGRLERDVVELNQLAEDSPGGSPSGRELAQGLVPAATVPSSVAEEDADA